MKLSEHFDESEFACKHCGELPANGISQALIDGLEKLRAVFGRPIHVTSGYRCEYWNTANGGVSNSQHIKGTAADIYIDGVGVYELGLMARRYFDGVGEYYNDGFVHVDQRNGGSTIAGYLWDDQE